MERTSSIERVYEELSTFARRARELSTELHPGLSLVTYTHLSYIDSRQDVRAADIVAEWGLDKSTVSRQVDQMVAQGLIERTAERPGRRGRCLALTTTGRSALARADRSVRVALVHQLEGWDDTDVTRFGELLARFNFEMINRDRPPQP